MNTRYLLAAALLLAGCPPPPQAPKPIDPDGKSGPDATREGAMPLDPGKVYTDSVDTKQGDQTDWKSVAIGARGTLAVSLDWANPQADITIDAFDPFGTQIAKSPINDGTSKKRLVVQITEPGIYYLRLQSVNADQPSAYNIQVEGGQQPLMTMPTPDEPPPEEKPKHVAPKKHRPAPAPKARRGGRPEDGVQGRIVSAHREGDSTVLYLDKGSAAGVAVGQNGWVLDGPAGATPVDGGSFTITEVVDAHRSIAKSPIHSIGRNNRISINISK